MKTRNYIFIAGPYQGEHTHGVESYLQIDRNIALAREAMAALVSRGYGVFCAHTHSAHFEVILPQVSAEYWYSLDIHFLSACDALYRLPGYSRGADREVVIARDMGIPVFESLDDLFHVLPVIKEG